MHNIDPKLKEHIIKLRIQDGRTYASLESEFGIPHTTIGRWITKWRKQHAADEAKAQQLADMEELRRLKEENEELKKENDFLKKAAAFFAKESK